MIRIASAFVQEDVRRKVVACRKRSSEGVYGPLSSIFFSLSVRDSVDRGSHAVAGHSNSVEAPMSTRAKCELVRLLECCDTRCPLSLSRRLAWCYTAMAIQVAGFFRVGAEVAEQVRISRLLACSSDDGGLLHSDLCWQQSKLIASRFLRKRKCTV